MNTEDAKTPKEGNEVEDVMEDVNAIEGVEKLLDLEGAEGLQEFGFPIDDPAPPTNLDSDSTEVQGNQQPDPVPRSPDCQT